MHVSPPSQLPSPLSRPSSPPEFSGHNMGYWSTPDANLAATTAPPRVAQQHAPLIKEYGARWEWDADAKDYVQFKDGKKWLYTDYQKGEGRPPSPTAQSGLHVALPPVPVPPVVSPPLPWGADMDP
ncbi:hypothetical protein C8A05DRAFT_34324, partial [Staphylotrichum tortipilum]